MNQTDFQIDNINWNAQQTAAYRGILEITLMPEADIDTIPDSLLYTVALAMRNLNSVYGIPVLLRYMHEMNGNWMVHYGMKPIEMKKSFQTLANYVHQLTNLTGKFKSFFFEKKLFFAKTFNSNGMVT
jgi:hypothetical protein